MRSLIAVVLVFPALSSAAAGDPPDDASSLKKSGQRCPFCQSVEKPGIVRLVSPPFVGTPPPFTPPALRPPTDERLQVEYPCLAPSSQVGAWPLPPLPNAPPLMFTEAPNPVQSFTGYLTQVYRLRNQPAAKVAAKIKAHLHNCMPGHFGKPPISAIRAIIIVPENVSNSLVVSAPGSAMKAITRQIAQLDRSPKQYRVRMLISKSHPKRGKEVISSPQIVTLAGRKAKVQIGGKEGFLEIEVIVNGIQEDSNEPANSRSARKTTARSAPRIYGRFTAPKPHVLTAKPRTAPDAAIGATPGFQPPHPRRIRLTGGRIPQPIPAAATQWEELAPDSVKPDFLSVKTYPISDLLKRCSGTTVVEFVRAAVLPRSWKRNPNRCTVIFFPATNSLVVRQTSHGHGQIAGLLNELRKNCASPR